MARANAPRMSRIEMVMHLQSVDMFRSCAATEAVRLAQIAEPVHLAQGEVIYQPTEPAATLYSVVEGKILIEGRGGYRREIGRHSAFGVLEVLSGRQRSTRAEARADSLVVAIEGEDFFDLLSNNIDIVKALFREVLDEQSRSRSKEMTSRETGAADHAPTLVDLPTPKGPIAPVETTRVDAEDKGGEDTPVAAPSRSEMEGVR